jgi:lipopolysaccharide export system ATP-binding protein
MKMVQEFSASNLRKNYGGINVVDGVELNITKGEVVGLLGPNGAGKTTTFYMMVGLIAADEGQVLLGTEDVTHFPIHVRARKGIGYLPQEASIFRDLSVEENIMAVLEGRDLSKGERETVLESLLNDFGVSRVRKSKGSTLSGGERRRVEIARALAMSPSFLLLDEPFAGIDPLAVSDLHHLIKELKNQGIGILITDHNVRETLNIVDRAYIMNAGRILVSGTPASIVADERARKFYLGDEFRM